MRPGWTHGGQSDVFCDTSRWWPRKHDFHIWLGAFSQVSSNFRRANDRRRLASHDSEPCGQCLTQLPWRSAACRWVAMVNLPVAEHWLLSVTAVCRCATPTSVGKIQETPRSFWWLVRIISKVGKCDGFDASGCLCLHWLVRFLITGRIELHCLAWSFVSHVDVRSFLVLHQAVVALRCRCWCVLVFLVE